MMKIVNEIHKAPGILRLCQFPIFFPLNCFNSLLILIGLSVRFITIYAYPYIFYAGGTQIFASFLS